MVKTLGIAMLLVFLVMWVFLGSLRATFIAAIVVPVALTGALVGLYFFGFSINILTLFAMVLAIGIVVDDTIVVVENVERIMAEEKLAAARGHAQGDGTDLQRDHRDQSGAGRSVHPDGILRRFGRRDLPPVRGDAAADHGVLGADGAFADTGTVCRHAEERRHA